MHPKFEADILVAIFLAAFILAIIAAFVYSHAAGNRLRTTEWEELVTAIQPIHSRGLEIVALDHLQPHGDQLRLEPEEMWSLIGGLQGLKSMQRNADLMIALAAYVQRWDYDQSIIVSERIRHDSILLKRALSTHPVESVWAPQPVAGSLLYPSGRLCLLPDDQTPADALRDESIYALP